MMRKWLFSLGIAGAFAAWASCSADTGKVFQGEGGGGGDSTSSSSSGTSSGMSSGGGNCDPFCTGTGSSTSSGSSGGVCNTDPAVDNDGDGYSENQNDCNDCDANVSPDSVEVIASDPSAEKADENCDGQIDNVMATCDGSFALDDPNPENAAKVLDICQKVGPGGNWGLVSASYVRANGSPASSSVQMGIMDKFGNNVNVQGGKQMLVLSSGTARTPGQPGACGTQSCYGAGAGQAPSGFPQDVPGCGGDSEINDDVGLELKLRAPKNANGYVFNFRFYSFEYPEYVCSLFNDQYISLVSPAPMGSINGNISFDAQKNPVSVNIAFFETCTGCPLGTADLDGTGFGGEWFGDAGATSWLQTTAPIKGGEEFSIRFAIWDTGDQILDSTVLLDNFQWLATGGTVVVGTGEVETPK
jgi:hypothetical protein